MIQYFLLVQGVRISNDFATVYSWRWYISIGLGNGVAPNGRQVVILTKVTKLYDVIWHHYTPVI